MLAADLFLQEIGWPVKVIKRFALALGLMPMMVAAAFAQMQQPRAVIELFTSQGCSSCPAADKVAAELARNPDLLVLSLPVDYWDYLGWKDTLAKSEFTQRQRAYSLLRGDKQVYTPQMVVNGVMHAVGSDRAEIANCVSKNNPSLALKLEEAAGTYKVSIPAKNGASGTVMLLPVLRSKTVAIGRGENHGATITYTNIVRGMIRVADWKGEAASFELPASALKSGDADSFVVVVQTGGASQPGQIVAAAKGPGL